MELKQPGNLLELFKKYGGENHVYESNDPRVVEVLTYRLHFFAVLNTTNRMSTRISKVSKLLYFASKIPEEKNTPELKGAIIEGKDFLRKELDL